MCFNQPYHFSYETEDDILSSDLSMLHAVLSKLDRRVWDAQTFRPRSDSLIRIQNILTAVNEDNIETTTSLEFDELNTRLVYKFCIKRIRPLRFFGHRMNGYRGLEKMHPLKA
ncbi:hypothetical protein H2248_001089 [Termitomyces sp. 'cryptogamus']|nr:hypothetical protein H2248_001089 [Termitomyces sp. 'cryptogamus']